MMKTQVDFNRIQDFLKIVESGNISRAAESLGRGKALLSRNLALLEKELGVQLVYRTTRQFRLTESGLEFYSHVRQHIRGLENLVLGLQDRGEAITGRIRLTAPDDLGVLVISPLVDDFLKQYPDVQFELNYTNQYLDLIKSGVDVAFRVGTMRDSSLLIRRVGHVDMILAASPRYLERSPAPLVFDELAHHDLIGFGLSRSHKWILNSDSHRRVLKFRPKLCANHFLAIKEFAIGGHGIAFMPRFLCEDALQRNDLVHVLKSWRNERSPIQIATPHQRSVPKVIRAFSDFAVRRLSEWV